LLWCPWFYHLVFIITWRRGFLTKCSLRFTWLSISWCLLNRFTLLANWWVLTRCYNVKSTIVFFIIATFVFGIIFIVSILFVCSTETTFVSLIWISDIFIILFIFTASLLPSNVWFSTTPWIFLFIKPIFPLAKDLNFSH